MDAIEHRRGQAADRYDRDLKQHLDPDCQGRHPQGRFDTTKALLRTSQWAARRVIAFGCERAGRALRFDVPEWVRRRAEP
jgi:hypothetical protein